MWIPGRFDEDESKTLHVRIAYLEPYTKMPTMAHTAIAEFEKFRSEYPIRDDAR